MYIETVPNRGSRPTILLRQGKREGKKVLKRTLANLTDWPTEKIEALRAVLRGQKCLPQGGRFHVERSLPHGHVQAVLGTITHLELDRLIASKPSRQRDLVVAMLAERLLHPGSKLATTRLWRTTTLAEALAVVDAEVEEVYAALDWLLARQGRIERKLAKRHLVGAEWVLYDVTSSSYEGRHCVLARYGNNRDGRRDRPCIVYGLLTDAKGRPVCVQVYPGDTGDPTTVPDQVLRLRDRFGLSDIVLVGDRGMLTQTQIDTLRQYPALGWISALRSQAIAALIAKGRLQRSLFDTQPLAQITSPAFPGERLVACFNPLLAEDRKRTRQELLEATEKALERIVKHVARRTRTPLKKDAIGLKVGKVINQYKVAKHFELTIQEGAFTYRRREEAIRREEQLDGIYVIRTSESEDRLSAADAVRHYKSLARVEQAFRCVKGVDIRVRPIFHRTEPRVRAHIFLCMLAYYVQWHMRQRLAPLLFHDEELEQARRTRDPVAPAKPSAGAKAKKRTRLTPEGLPVHSFQTLLADLGTRCRNRCRVDEKRVVCTFDELTEPTPLQTRAFALLGIKPD
jgi:hypothetical protein